MVFLRGFLILFATGLLGGGIAFFGNQLGRYIGRKKLSIFNLRPRYTSMLITIFTGMLVASLTLGLAMIFSEPIRITLLSPKEYQIRESNLIQKINELRKLQQTDLVYKKQDVILSALVKSDNDTGKMQMALKEIVARANDAALNKSKNIAKDRGEEFAPPQGGRLVGYIPDNLNSVARELSRLRGEQLIFVRAASHAALGDRFYVELGTPITNSLVYQRGELIHKAKIDGKQDYFAIYDQILQNIKDDVSKKAIYRGVFPDPQDRSVGEFDEKQLKEIAKSIKKADKTVVVEFISKDDTYIRGPLKLDFAVKKE